MSLINQPWLPIGVRIQATFVADAEKEKESFAEIFSGTLKYNRDYTVVIPKGTRVMVKPGVFLPIPEAVTFGFSSEFRPLYADVKETALLLEPVEEYMNQKELLTEIRNASQKANQLLGLQPNPNIDSYSEISENNEIRHAVEEYVKFEAAMQLAARAAITISRSEGTITLGDLTITENKTAQSMKDLISSLREEAEYWKNVLLGKPKDRKSALPVSTVTRKVVPSPTERGLT